MRITNRNGFMVLGTSITKLHLSGNKLLIYSLIASYTNSNVGTFNKSKQWIADTLKMSRSGVIKAINELMEDGLIIRTAITLPNNIEQVEYKISNVTEFTPENCSRTEFNWIHDDNDFNIRYYMIQDLNLSGNQLLLYANIKRVSQDGKSICYATNDYLAEWCDCDERTVKRGLDKLLKAGLIQKKDNGYICTSLKEINGSNGSSEDKSVQGVQEKTDKSVQGFGQKCTPHNNNQTNTNSNGSRHTTPSYKAKKVFKDIVVIPDDVEIDFDALLEKARK